VNITVSKNWTFFRLDLEHETLHPANAREALRRAMASDTGILTACGSNGDGFELQFDRRHAFLLYGDKAGTTLRPRFPDCPVKGDGVERYFCRCCGVQIGDNAKLLRSCMPRETGFSMVRKFLRGHLARIIGRGVPVEWRPLTFRGSEEHAEQ
jgi:hypothetical protein